MLGSQDGVVLRSHEKQQRMLVLCKGSSGFFGFLNPFLLTLHLPKLLHGFVFNLLLVVHRLALMTF